MKSRADWMDKGLQEELSTLVRGRPHRCTLCGIRSEKEGSLGNIHTIFPSTAEQEAELEHRILPSNPIPLGLRLMSSGVLGQPKEKVHSIMVNRRKNLEHARLTQTEAQAMVCHCCEHLGNTL
jgi:hypothetical protein